jgi:hypothetical protein
MDLATARKIQIDAMLAARAVVKKSLEAVKVLSC